MTRKICFILLFVVSSASSSQIREMFTTLDKNGSGTLTVEELKGALVEFPDIAAEIETMVIGIDLDGNNSVDYNEFIAATLSRNTYIRDENIK